MLSTVFLLVSPPIFLWPLPSGGFSLSLFCGASGHLTLPIGKFLEERAIARHDVDTSGFCLLKMFHIFRTFGPNLEMGQCLAGTRRMKVCAA